MERERHFLYFLFPSGARNVRYNLDTCIMERFTEKKKWEERSQCYWDFRDAVIEDIETTDEKFKRMMRRVKLLNSSCENVSSFIGRLGQVLITEGFDAEGIKYECDYNRYGWKQIVSKPLHFYHKQLIEWFKRTDYRVTIDFEEGYVSHKKDIDSMVQSINTMELSDERLKVILDNFGNSGSFAELVVEHKYDVKALIGYLFDYLEPFENVEFKEGATLLRDYYNMGHQIGRKLKKYPKYLKSMHDIILANYNAFKKEYDEELFGRLARNDLEYENGKYAMIIPTTTKHVIEEGTNLNHCVSSYVEKILKKEVYIMFLRYKLLKEDSLVTIEVIGKKITQAKGSCNRAPSEDEKKFLKEYCERKRLKLEVKVE